MPRADRSERMITGWRGRAAVTLGHMGVLLLLTAWPALAQSLDPGEDEGAASEPALVEAYGTGPKQFGELRLPEGKGPFPVAILIHGGCWTSEIGSRGYMAPLAEALAKDGIATWNVEYRQVGDAGGGWPGTFLDWGAAADHLRAFASSQPLDLGRVTTIGHSAGAPAAVWIAARGKLPATSPIRGGDPLPIRAAIPMDGPLDLADFAARKTGTCGAALRQLMGGTAKTVPSRYAEASPDRLLPLGLPQFLVVATGLRKDAASTYQRRAKELGDKVEVLTLPHATHFDVVDPGSKAWPEVERFILSRAFSKK